MTKETDKASGDWTDEKLRVDNAENRLKDTFFIVEATSYEQFSLWEDWSDESDSPRRGRLKWQQVNPGWLVTVGKVGKRPCCISVQWNLIEGRLVMFWYQCSQVTDSLQAEAWLEKHFTGRYDNGYRRAWTDAQNFAHCIHAIQDANKEGPTTRLKRPANLLADHEASASSVAAEGESVPPNETISFPDGIKEGE